MALVVSGFSAALVFVTTQAAILERTRQIGLLRALGLGRAATLQLVLIESLALSVGGALVGIVLALLASGFVPWLLPSVSVRLDPATGASVLGAAVLGGVLGALGPALRAARLDPAVALETP